MTITPLSDAFGPNPVAPPSTGSGDSLGRDEFLKLLVAQLQNQDPMNPQEGHEFAAQLAQFTSVEQLAAIGTTLQGHTAQLAALAQGIQATAAQTGELGASLGRGLDLSAATALIGQTIEVGTDRLAWTGQSAPTVGFDLAGAADNVTVTIRNEAGEVVRVLSPGARGEGAHTLAWDGTDGNGEPLPHGTYRFEVNATDASGGTIEAERFTRGTVDRLTIETGGVQLWLGGFAVPLDRLRGVVAP